MKYPPTEKEIKEFMDYHESKIDKGMININEVMTKMAEDIANVGKKKEKKKKK